MHDLHYADLVAVCSQQNQAILYLCAQTADNYQVPGVVRDPVVPARDELKWRLALKPVELVEPVAYASIKQQAAAHRSLTPPRPERVKKQGRTRARRC